MKPRKEISVLLQCLLDRFELITDVEIKEITMIPPFLVFVVEHSYKDTTDIDPQIRSMVERHLGAFITFNVKYVSDRLGVDLRRW